MPRHIRHKRLIFVVIIMIALLCSLVFAVLVVEAQRAAADDLRPKQLELVHVVSLFFISERFESNLNYFFTVSMKIFRHGTRTPADTYPNDPYLNFTFDPFGWGALTNVSNLLVY